MDTGRRASHTEVCGRGTRGGTLRGGDLGRDNMGWNASYRWWGGKQQTTLPGMYLCNNPACSSHVPQNLKCNKIFKNFLKIKKLSQTLPPIDKCTPSHPTYICIWINKHFQRFFSNQGQCNMTWLWMSTFFFFWDKVSLCRPGWSAVAWSWLTAISASWV